VRVTLHRASAGSLVMRGWLRDDAGESLVDEAFRIVVVLVALIVALVALSDELARILARG